MNACALKRILKLILLDMITYFSCFVLLRNQNITLQLISIVGNRIRINLLYGKDKIVIVDVPDKNISYIVDSGAALPLEKPQDEIRRSLRH